MSIEIALSLIYIISVDLTISSYAIYCMYELKKSNNIISSLLKNMKTLSKDEEEYLDIVHHSEEEYFEALSLVIEKEKEIAKLDCMDSTYEEFYDIDENIVEEKQYIRKLERK